MCGIAGLLSTLRIDPALLEAMTDPIAHRGPDDRGHWIDQAAGVGLGHRRLSIVDLSPNGHQPMESHNARFVLTYNGEIYNHRELRKQLDAGGPRAWRGHSDTETLLEAISEWGLTAALQAAVGMFALAVWDRHERKLHLARDRFGEKPLYYGWVGRDFLFSSELKSMRPHPEFNNDISRTALRLLTARLCIAAPLSIFEHIYKLEPGCILSVTADALAQRPSAPPSERTVANGVSLERYWSYKQLVAAGIDDPIHDQQEALEQLDAALGASVRAQSVADVPVGAFLSGGIDSSLIVGLYQRYSTRSIRTFTIGFEEDGFNEAQHAKAVASYFGTQHEERYVTSQEAQQVLPLLSSMYDEPFADSSQIPTYLVSRLAREQVTVSLSGDGGDELFGGYNRYTATARVWGHLCRLPRAPRRIMGKMLSHAKPGAWNAMMRLLSGGRQSPYFGTKAQKAFHVIGHARAFEDVFQALLDEWYGFPSPVLGVPDDAPAFGLDLDLGRPAAPVARMMYCDAVTYLPDDILCKVDRASMAVSLEARVPFLDHRVAAIAARIPPEMKIRGSTGKVILRKLLYGMAPKELFDRPKAGFGIPLREWVTGPLRPWAESLIDEQRLKSEGYFDSQLIHARWKEILTGTRYSAFSVWTVMMFQAWLADFNRTSRPSQTCRLAS
jgi:asparagine synthase (glutamine-hydrolysing)